jgi:chromosome segregation protein
MIIKKIELQGFKSFPERTKILFHPGITSIVGPNGTGKSNIVDALLWVLGGQRMKSQRAERSGDVIFNGNAKKTPLGMADVTLFLKDDDEELAINHRLFRSGESEYRLNGKLARLKEIQDSLWKRDIAEKEYFVIEQGQIGLFLNSKPSEKRLYLEEAAGTAFYKDKKKQAQSKLEDSEQNLIRLEDIIAEVSRAKNSLARQAGAAIRYKKLREKIRQLKSLHYRKKIALLEKNLHETIQHFEDCLNQETSSVSRLKTEEKDLGKKRAELWNLEKSIKDFEKRLLSQKSQLGRLETEKEKEEKRIEFFAENKKRASETTEEIKAEISQLEKNTTEAAQNLEIFSEQLRKKQEDLKQAVESSQASQAKLLTWVDKIKTLRSEYLEKISEHTETKNEGVKLEKERELILRQKEKLERQLQEGQNLLQEKEKELERQKDELIRTQELEAEKEKTSLSRQKMLDEILVSFEKLQNKISEMERRKDEALHYLQALEKLEKEERGSAGGEDMPGAIGLLADLLEADAEHAPLIDLIWKEEAKATLIPVQDYLKMAENKELKGHFLLLSSQKKDEPSGEILKEPQVLGLFKSYLRPSPRIKDFLAQLQEAVMVNDVKSAIQLWLRFPSFSYLTLNGDLLLSSGLLKLGQKKEGIFTLSQEIKRLKETIGLLQKGIEPLSLERKEKTEQIQILEEEVRKEKGFLAQHQEKIEEIEKEITFKQKEKDNIKTQLDLLEDESRILTQEQEALDKKIDDLAGRRRTLEEEETALKNLLEEKEGQDSTLQEENEQRKKYFFELKGSIDLLQEKIRNLNDHLQSQRQRKESLKSKIDSLQEEIKNCEVEQSQSKEKIASLSQEIREAKEEGKRLETELSLKDSNLQLQKKELEEMEKKIEESREECERRKEERVKWEISKAERERDFVNLEESCWQDLKKSTKEVKEEISEKMILETNVEEKLAKAEEELQKFKSVNLMAEEEYLVQKKRYDFLIAQKKDLRDSIDATREAIQKIDEESKSQFLKALAEVNTNLQDIFSILFNGGNAELKLVDSSQPLESGVEIIAQPPGKRVQSLSLLSGGEKTLTSLAFFFALFRYKPTPFCILDEVDAALDDVNLTRFLELMKKTKSQTQFIIITHNVKTMEVADYIYGTTMAEPNITSLYSIKLEKKEGNSA